MLASNNLVKAYQVYKASFGEQQDLQLEEEVVAEVA
jgi:hypothetical protein